MTKKIKISGRRGTVGQTLLFSNKILSPDTQRQISHCFLEECQRNSTHFPHLPSKLLSLNSTMILSSIGVHLNFYSCSYLFFPFNSIFKIVIQIVVAILRLNLLFKLLFNKFCNFKAKIVI
jgi:hypothetical protein